MSELTDLLARYGTGYVPSTPSDADYSTADIAYQPPTKAERLRRAWQETAAAGAADMARKAQRPQWGDTRWKPLPLPWPLDYPVPLPARNSNLGEFAETAMLAPLGARGGLGGSTGGLGFLTSRYDPAAMPRDLYIPGGSGLFDEVPWLPPEFASQPREMLGAGVAPPLALTKHDATPMQGPDADAMWEEAGRSYPLRAQALRIINDFADKPVYHTWNSLRQIPMMTGYTVPAESAAALGLFKYLPTFIRAKEPPIPGTLGAAIQAAKDARQAERSAP